MKIVLSIAFLLVLFVGMTIPSFAQVSDSLQVSIDKTGYLPGSYVKISAISSEVIPFEGLKFSVSDPNGKIIEKGILYPTNGQFNSSVFISSINPVYGDYEIKFQYSDIAKSIFFQVVSDVKEDSLISLDSEKRIYGLGETVNISGTLNKQWIRYLQLEIIQTKNIATSGLGGYNFKILDTINVNGDGSFEYSFTLPTSDSGLGDYAIRVYEDLGDYLISISVVDDPELFSSIDDQLYVKSDKTTYDLTLDKTIIIDGKILFPAKRSSFETTPVRISLFDSQGIPMTILGQTEGSKSLSGTTEIVPLTFTSIPDLSGNFEQKIDIGNILFAPGNYQIVIEYEGIKRNIDLELVSSKNDYLYINKDVFSLGEIIQINGKTSTSECCIQISITKPDGTLIRSGVQLNNQAFEWQWKLPSSEKSNLSSILPSSEKYLSNLGIYRITVSTDSSSKDLFFKVSKDPENDSLSLSPIFVNLQKNLFYAGEKLHVDGKIFTRMQSVGLGIPDRVVIQVLDSSLPPKLIHESAIFPSSSGVFSSEFELPITIFKSGNYEVRSFYGQHSTKIPFTVVNEYEYGGDDDLTLILESNQKQYFPGDSVQITGKPNKLIYLEEYKISLIKKSESEITCGSFICGVHQGSITSILPGPNGSFVYEFVIPNSSDSVGNYEVTVDADFETKHLVFSVVDKIPVKSPEILFEKQNRIIENTVGIKLESKINENSILLPRVLSGSLISVPGDESKVNLKVSNELGQCIIGQDDDCLVSESTRKPGQIFDTVSVNGESFKVRYSGTDARLEKFNILPENDESFLPLENWTVEVIKENQPSKLYYKVTYKLQ